MKTIKDIGDLKGKRVVIRVDFNVPVTGGVVSDDYRIQKTLPTIRIVREAGAQIILITHFETNEGADFKIVADYVSSHIPMGYCQSFEKADVDKALSESASGIVLLQNLRIDAGEKKNSVAFAKKLASLGDIYINEAFSASHREHASIVGIPKYIPGYMGEVFASEVRALSLALVPPEKSLFILGGAKFDTKMPLIKKFAKVYKHIAIGGALANTIYKSEGLDIGKSHFDEGDFKLPKKKTGEYTIPSEVIVENKGQKITKKKTEVSGDDVIMDAGPAFARELLDIIADSDFVLWNGPFGLYEKGYKDATLQVARELSQSPAHSIIGGGDTVAAIAELGLNDAFDHVSTGGGAMLDFLANDTLPGIEALK